MPQNVLDYAQPHPKPQAVVPEHKPFQQSRWYRVSALALALSVIAVPIGSLTIPLFDHSYGLIGAAVFVVGTVSLFNASSWNRRRVVIGAFISSIIVTAVLHVASLNTILLENASGQSIESLYFSLSGSNSMIEYHNVPPGEIVRIRVYDLSYDGGGNIALGQLADGTQLHDIRIDGTRYHGVLRIRIKSKGDINMTWP